MPCHVMLCLCRRVMSCHAMSAPTRLAKNLGEDAVRPLERRRVQAAVQRLVPCRVKGGMHKAQGTQSWLTADCRRSVKSTTPGLRVSPSPTREDKHVILNTRLAEPASTPGLVLRTNHTQKTRLQDSFCGPIILKRQENNEIHSGRFGKYLGDC